MSEIRRIYVEKKEKVASEARALLADIREFLGIKSLEGIRVVNRYDVENIDEELFEQCKTTVFSEPQLDDIYDELKGEGIVFAVEALPGQYDQRADSAAQCIGFIDPEAKPIVKSAITYVIKGNVSDEDMDRIKAYCVNPVDSRINDAPKPETLVTEYDDPEDVKIFDGFKDMSEADLKALYDSLGLAMTFKDFQHIQNYFAGEEKRDPSMTEIRVLDTYWSDHCRHTTFSTNIENVDYSLMRKYLVYLYEKNYSKKIQIIYQIFKKSL